MRTRIDETNFIAVTKEPQIIMTSRIYRCVVPGCNYCATDSEDVEAHMTRCMNEREHIKYNKKVAKYGSFYGTLRYLVKKLGRIPTIEEYLGRTNKYTCICSVCRRILPNREDVIKEHYEKLRHKDRREKIEKVVIEERPIKMDNRADNVKKIWDKTNGDGLRRLVDKLWAEDAKIEEEECLEVQEYDMREANDSEEMEKDETDVIVYERERTSIIPENIRTRDSDGKKDDLASIGVREVNVRIDRDNIRNEDIRMNRESNNHIEVTEEERKRKDKMRKAMRWKREGIERSRRGYRNIRLDGDRRKLVKEGLTQLYENEIIPLLEEYKPRDDSEEEWSMFEGACYHVMNIIRTHVLNKLGMRAESMFKRRRCNYINKEKESFLKRQRRINKVRRVANLVENIHEAIEEQDITRREKLSRKLENTLMEFDDKERRKWWRTEEIGEIKEEVMRQCNDPEVYGKWLEEVYMVKCLKVTSEKRRNMIANKVKQDYSDNPMRTMRNQIWEEERPQCKIEIEEIEKYFTNIFGRKKTSEEWNDVFEVGNCMEEGDEEEMIEFMTRKSNILKAINSRKWLSAAGPDGIDYAVYKMGGKQCAKMFQLIIRVMLERGRMPDMFKESRTLLAYKKGDVKELANWRPISISNCNYRIMTVILANCILHMNKRRNIMESVQKGFVDGVSGCIENALTVSELFADARRRHRDLIVVALDFKNAFGSVDHNFMLEVLRRKGFGGRILSLIGDLYINATTYVETEEGRTRLIDIKVGTKQGCPLSPLLFNISIDPLLKKLEDMRDFGYKLCKGAKYAVQAYADDLILISKDNSGINKMLETVQDFSNMSNVFLSPQKCTGYVYVKEIGSKRRVYDADIRIGGTKIDVVGKDKVIRYLGAPVVAKSNERMKNNKMSEVDFKELLDKVMFSKLSMIQKVHAIKTFLLPKFEYGFMASQYGRSMMEKLDKFLRGRLNRIMGGVLCKAIYHGSCKDGGFGIPAMRDRQDIAVIRSFLTLKFSRDPKTRNMIEECSNNERIKRGIEEKLTKGNVFLDWHQNEDGSIGKGTHSIAARCYIALKNMGMKLQFEEDKGDKALKLIRGEKEKVIESKEDARVMLLQTMREKWKEKLNRNTLHLHTFQDLVDSPISNGMMLQGRSKINDNLLKFIVGARGNILLTQEIKELYEGRRHESCKACGKEVNGSLCHMLNGCHANNDLIIKRHNTIMHYLAVEMRKSREEKVIEDRIIEDVELDECANMKPDIQIWNEDRTRVRLVEVNVPYGRKWRGTSEGSLEEHYRKKKEKYDPLVRELKMKGIEAKLYIVVVSSLGAVERNTEKELHRYFGNRQRTCKVLRKISMLALIGSATIWWKRSDDAEEAREGVREDGSEEEEEGEEVYGALNHEMDADMEEEDIMEKATEIRDSNEDGEVEKENNVLRGIFSW